MGAAETRHLLKKQLFLFGAGIQIQEPSSRHPDLRICPQDPCSRIGLTRFWVTLTVTAANG